MPLLSPRRAAILAFAVTLSGIAGLQLAACPMWPLDAFRHDDCEGTTLRPCVDWTDCDFAAGEDCGPCGCVPTECPCPAGQLCMNYSSCTPCTCESDADCDGAVCFNCVCFVATRVTESPDCVCTSDWDGVAVRPCKQCTCLVTDEPATPGDYPHPPEYLCAGLSYEWPGASP